MHDHHASGPTLLLPLREKVPEGRMRGLSSHVPLQTAGDTVVSQPLIRRFAPPSPARGEGTVAARSIRALAVLLALLLALFSPLPALAQADDATLTTLVDALAPGSFKDREAAAKALAATEDPRAVPVLQTLLDGDLYATKATGKVLFLSGDTATDPVTGAPVEGIGKADTEKVKVNNGLRRALRTIIGQLTLHSDDRAPRLSAAQSVLRDANPDNLEL